MNQDMSSPIEPVEEERKVHVALPSKPPVITYLLIGFTVLIYALQWISVAVWGYAIGEVDWLMVFGGRLNESMRAGELWRFVTPVFLHGSPAHIFFNMYALFSLGTVLENHYGHLKFIALYFLGNFAGITFSFLFTGDDSFSIGASTAVFGLIAAEFIFAYQNRELFGDSAKKAMGNAVFFIFVNLLISLTPGIDLWGHVGGMLGGGIFAWFGGPRWKVETGPLGYYLEDMREFRGVITGAALVVLLFGGLAVWGMVK